MMIAELCSSNVHSQYQSILVYTIIGVIQLPHFKLSNNIYHLSNIFLLLNRNATVNNNLAQNTQSFRLYLFLLAMLFLERLS